MALFGKKNSELYLFKGDEADLKREPPDHRGDREKEKPETYSGVGIFKLR